MNKGTRLKLLLILPLIAAILTTDLPVNTYAAESSSASSQSSAIQAQNAQKEEEKKLAAESQAATQKADQLISAGKLNCLNSDSADIQVFTQTVHLNMPKNTETFWFRIPKGTVLKDDCTLNLDMLISSTLIDNRSSISIAVNGTTLETKWIYSIVKNEASWWSVKVPAKLLKTDGNSNGLTITTAQRSIEGDCADIDNPSNWVRFDPDSYLHLAVASYAKPYLGNLYSYFYDNLDDRNSMKNEFILPKEIDASAVSNMLKVSAAIGASGRDKDILKFRVSSSAARDNSIKNKIYLGLLQNWSGNSSLLLPGPLTEKEGFLSVKGNNALITGRSEPGLKRAANFFSNSAYLNQIGEDSLIVQSDIPDASQNMKKNDSGFYTFQDFGYGDINLAGAFHQSTTLKFIQPGGVKSGSASYINVKFRHSKALNTDNSLLTVYINDVPYGSARLNSSNTDNGEVKVRIPDDALRQESITVKIDVYNYLGKIDCSKDWYDTAWTVIDKSSQVYFEPGSTGVTPTLLNFPSFSTITSDHSNDIVMAAPSISDTEQLTLMSLLSAKTGQNCNSVFNFSVTDSPDSLPAQNRNNNMIVIGSYDTIKLPPEVSSALGVAPLSGTSFRISKDLTLSSETLKNKILIQVIRSPWNFYKKIYFITYDRSMQNSLAKFLSDKTLGNQLTGQLCVIDAQNNVTSYNLNSGESAEKVPLTWERVKYLIENAIGLPIWAILIILALLIFCVVLFIRVVRNKRRFQKNAEAIRSRIEGNPVNESRPLSQEENSTPVKTRISFIDKIKNSGRKGPRHLL